MRVRVLGIVVGVAACALLAASPARAQSCEFDVELLCTGFDSLSTDINQLPAVQRQGFVTRLDRVQWLLHPPDPVHPPDPILPNACAAVAVLDGMASTADALAIQADPPTANAYGQIESDVGGLTGLIKAAYPGDPCFAGLDGTSS